MTASTQNAPKENGRISEQTGSIRALILATAAFMICFTVWGLIAPLAPAFRARYDLSGLEVGVLVAVPVLLGSLARIPLGIVADRAGRTTFTALMVGLTVPLALAGATNSYGTLLSVSFFLGLAGASFAVGVPFVSRWFPPAKRGFALGIYGMGNLGTAISGFLAPRLEERIGWRATFWSFIPILLVMAALFWFLGRDPPEQPRLRLATQLIVFRDRPLSWVLALFYFVTFGGFVGISVYLPALLVDAHGLTRTDAGTRTAVFVVLATLARPVGGYLADRWASTVILDIVFVVIAALAIVLAFEPGMAVLTAAFLGIATALGVGNGAVFRLVASIFPRETGTVTGLVGAAGGLGGFFPPLVLSAVHEATGSHAIAFMLLSEFALGCLIVNLLVLQRWAIWLVPERELVQGKDEMPSSRVREREVLQGS